MLEEEKKSPCDEVQAGGLEKSLSWMETPEWSPSRTTVGQQKFRYYFKCNGWLLKSCNQKNAMTSFNFSVAKE